MGPQPITTFDPIAELRFWQRFHVRLTLAYATAVFLILGVAGTLSYRFAVDARMTGLQERLLITAQALAEGIEAEALVGPLGASTASHRDLHDRFRQTARLDASVHAIYVMRFGMAPGELEFVVDWARDGDVAEPGSPYDATALPVLLRGLERPSVEERLFVDAWGASLSGYAPVRDASGESVGLVGVDVMEETIGAIRRTVFVSTAGLTLGAAFMLALVGVGVGRSVRGPLASLIEAAAAVSEGAFHTRLGLRRDDEFGVVGRHFDRMAAGLAEREVIRDTFGRYVSPEVARQVLASADGPKLGGEERVVTVLFSDLRGYSTICEGLGASEVVALLNRYLAGMQEVIDAHDGVVIEFLGDAILAVFGAPVPQPDHAEKAVRCATEMRARLAALNVTWEREGLASSWQQVGLDALRHRIGVHSGTVVAGNLGSATRVKYAVIGDTVNIAARLEQLNKELGTEILLSGDTLDQLPGDLVARVSDRGEIRIKGRAEPVRVHEVG